MVTLLVGEALFFGSLGILAWAAIFLVVNHVFFLLAEEPGLEGRFGDEYRAHKAASWLTSGMKPGAEPHLGAGSSTARRRGW